jgi:hypothetical protein
MVRLKSPPSSAGTQSFTTVSIDGSGGVVLRALVIVHVACSPAAATTVPSAWQSPPCTTT